MCSYAARLCLLATLLGCGQGHAPTTPRLRLATTTSTRDSGLLDLLLPLFQSQHGVQIDVIAAGTGKALKLGEAGDVDVVLVHAREAEEAFMAAGHGVRREEVMYNTFQLLGPPDDPARVRDLEPPEALGKIADGGHRFISRGDDSGTHKRESKLWRSAGGRPEWHDYIETGQGMGATLCIADQMRGYVLADRGTYLSFREKIDLVPLAKQTPEMRNVYGILVVNPETHSAVNVESAEALVNFFVSPAAQKMISEYQIAGEALFVPLHWSPAK